MSQGRRRYDPYASVAPSWQARAGRYAVFALLAVGVQAASVAVLVGARSLAPTVDPEPPLVFVEIVEPEPLPEVVPEPPPEPEPPAPEPEVAAPVPPPDEAPPEPEIDEPPPEPREVAAVEPPPAEPPPETRPIEIALEGQSFADGAGGPTFAQGDTAHGGRPTRRSVDPNDSRVASADAQPSAPAAEPTPDAGRGTREVPEDRQPRLRRGVDREAPFPEDAQRRGIETDCIAQIVVGVDGDVTDITSISCGETGLGFEDALREHIEANFRFEPAITNGVPAEYSLRWVQRFRISE